MRIDSEDLEGTEPAKALGTVAGIIVPGGFGDRGVEGKIAACRYAREKRLPYLGLCLGMQVATIEFARNVCGLKGANSTEFEEHTPHPVICLLEDQKEVRMKGASMRLGAGQRILFPGLLPKRCTASSRLSNVIVIATNSI